MPWKNSVRIPSKWATDSDLNYSWTHVMLHKTDPMSWWILDREVSRFPVCLEVLYCIINQYWERECQTDAFLHALLPPVYDLLYFTALKSQFGNAMASTANQPTVEQLICGNVLLRNTGQPPHLDHIEYLPFSSSNDYWKTATLD